MATITYNETIVMKQISCAHCGVMFALTEDYQNKLKDSHSDFYCPSGHLNYYPQYNEAEKLRKELKRKEQELADQVQAKIKIANDNAKLSRDLTRLKKGVCHRCNRSFHNLHNHMKKQHPDCTK